jgi:hypothetical protein
MKQAPTPFDEQAPTPEPVYEPIDDQGNVKPVKSFADLIARNQIEDLVTPYPEMPEAGGIAWTDANLQYGEKGLVLSVNRLNITARGITPVAALNDLLRTLAYVESMGIKVHLEPAAQSLAKKATGTPQANATAQTQPKQTVTPAKPAAQAPAPAAPAQVGTLTSEGESKMRIVKIVSTPLPGGKFVLGFHAAGHPKYPDVSTFKNGIEPDVVMQILDNSGYDFTPEMLNPTQAIAFDVNCECYWKPSQTLKKTGEPYKNFVRLAPVGG